MSCFFPKVCVKNVWIGSDGKLVKKLYGFYKSTEERRKSLAEVAKAQSYSFIDGGYCFSDVVEIPCEKCLGCRLDYARGWAERIMLEASLYPKDQCWFITFTFDNDHMPVNCSVDKKFVKDFQKRFREYFRSKFGQTGIRFFMCYEYGKKNLRPHLHYIFFGLDIPDVKPFVCGRDVYYESVIIDSIWGQGFTVIGKVTFKSAGYVARYTMKKAGNFLLPDGRVPEYVNMSRKPGIARKWFDDHFTELYSRDGVLMKSGQRISLVRPAPYFDKLMNVIDPDKLDDVKFHRRMIAIARLDDAMSKTTNSLDEQRKIDFDALVDRVVKLKRKIEV